MAHASKMREFMISVTYGTLTGTIIGAASLAFTEKPGDKLYRIARGASLGLYSGIALGYYVTSVYPNSQEEVPEMENYPEAEAPMETGYLMNLAPIFNEQGKVDGVFLNFQLVRI